MEAKGTGLNLTRGDLALRVNFATIDSLEKGNILDRRAGRNLTTEEAEILCKALNKISLPVKFEIVPSVQHRAVLVFRGGFSDNLVGNDLTYVNGKTKGFNKIHSCEVLDEEDNSQYTVNILNEFLDKAYDILKDHPVNLERKKKGFLPSNYLLVRGAGIEIPKLKQYKKWASVAYMPLEIGFSKLSGMNAYEFDYPKLKSFDAYENLYNALKKACKFSVKIIKKIMKTSEYLYIHIKETDLPGHDNKPLEKKEMLEYIDKTLFKYIRKVAPPNEIKVVVTGDHSTPCKLKDHSSDPVPVLFYNNKEVPEEKHFNEKECRKGRVGRILGKDLLKRVGFSK